MMTSQHQAAECANVININFREREPKQSFVYSAEEVPFLTELTVRFPSLS